MSNQAEIASSKGIRCHCGEFMLDALDTHYSDIPKWTQHFVLGCVQINSPNLTFWSDILWNRGESSL